MSIRSNALKWLSANFGDVKGKIYTSKYYLPEESWPKTHVWWPQIPISAIDENEGEYINLLCQVAPNEDKFHYLKVPISFLKGNLEKFHKEGKIISLYLSADPTKLFIEERGIGNLDFSVFIVH